MIKKESDIIESVQQLVTDSEAGDSVKLWVHADDPYVGSFLVELYDLFGIGNQMVEVLGRKFRVDQVDGYVTLIPPAAAKKAEFQPTLSDRTARSLDEIKAAWVAGCERLGVKMVEYPPVDPSKFNRSFYLQQPPEDTEKGV